MPKPPATARCLPRKLARAVRAKGVRTATKASKSVRRVVAYCESPVMSAMTERSYLYTTDFTPAKAGEKIAPPEGVAADAAK